MLTEQVQLFESFHKYSILCRVLSIARCAIEAELATFLGKLDPDYILSTHLQCGRMASGQHITLQTPESQCCSLVVCQSYALMT